MDDKQEKKYQTNREEILKKIMESLGVASRTELVGEAGIGKTWLAKEVSERVQENPSSYTVLWLHLNKRIEDEKSLYENLAAQLSIIHVFEEGEESDDEIEYTPEILKDKITHKIKKNKKGNLLLILDDVGSKTTEEHVMVDLKLEEFLEKHSTLKRLVTRRGERKNDSIEVPPLTDDQSLDLLRGSEEMFKSFTTEDWPLLLKRLYDDKEIKEPTLMSCILSKSKGLPAAIVVLTKSLNGIKFLSEKQRKIFKELILSSKSLDEAAASKYAIERKRYNPVLQLSYELLKLEETLEETPKRPVIACFWHILDFYNYAGCAYYRDLIVHWMLEGYFDPVKSVEKAYQEGHSILMEFMNRGILKIQEDNIVVPEVSMNNLLDLEDCGFFGRSRLGFDRVYGGDKSKGLGKIILIDDMIQTIPLKKKKKNVTARSRDQAVTKTIKTIMVSGNRLRREVPGKFFEKPEMQDLEVVVLFEPTFHDLVKSLSSLKKLRVLVIRDCDLIEDISKLMGLQNLHVFEVSSACSLANIPDDFFKNMTELQSLNLSGLAIKSLPSTIEKLRLLRCFIVRDCSELQDLPNFIVETKDLEVIDVRGARNLESYFDRVKDWKEYKGKNKNFARLQELQHLDFSDTQIIRLPIFHLKEFNTMPKLTRLLIRKCTRLKRLPQLAPLTKLQILDACGATNLVEVLEVCLEKKEELRILNFSETSLPELADTINGVVNLSKLRLRNCSRIKELPKIVNLTKLEVFDVSGSNNLEKIDDSFGKMSYLHEVDLSGTNLDQLPKTISELSNLKKLIIRNCSKLKALLNLEKLIHLEIFNVSGCTELESIEGSFENMSYLHEVDLSGTNIDQLPKTISELSNLKKLIIRNCSKLKALLNLEKLIHLEIFDVSGCTELESIEGSFENMSYLREVNLSQTKLKKSPELPKQSSLCSIKRIVLPNSMCLEREEWSQIKEYLEANPEASSFSNAADKTREKDEKLVHQENRYKVLDPEVPSDINIIEISKSVNLETEQIAKLEYVSIAENGSTSLSSVFDKFQMKSVKGCWVERCNMNILFEYDEKQEKDESSSSSLPLENLWISNLPLLKSLYNTSKGGIIFKNLKKLTIDCCPRITTLFPEIPDNLEVLRVKFCDKLERLFEEGAEERYRKQVEDMRNDVSVLPRLKKLQLLDLPVLSTIGAKLPDLVDRTIKKCPSLKGGEDDWRIGSRRTEEISEDQSHKNFGPEAQSSSQPTKASV